MYKPIEEIPFYCPEENHIPRPGAPVGDAPPKKPRKIRPWPDGKRDRQPWIPGVQA